MKVLFTFEAGEGTIFPYAPFAQAVRHAGHQVLAAGSAAAVPALTSAGLPVVVTSTQAPRAYLTAADGAPVTLPADRTERERALGAIGARMGLDAFAGLRSSLADWRPDAVVGCAGAYAGVLLAAEAGAPFVHFGTDLGEPALRHRSALDELRARGFTGLPDPVLSLTTCPPSIRPAEAPPADRVRHVPYATPVPVEPWMITRGARPRVLVSAGSRVSRDYALDRLIHLIEAALGLDADLLVAASDDIVSELPPLPAGSHAGWIPTDLVLSTCDLAVHHGGGITLGCLAAGIPQIFVPFMPEIEDYTARICEYGAARTSRDDVDDIVDACREVLADPAYGNAATTLGEEIAAAPLPAELVRRLESLT